MNIVMLALTWALAGITSPSVSMTDVTGVVGQPLEVPSGGLVALFFVTDDCPISNYYALEIRSICDMYAGGGLSCNLIYVDPSLSDARALSHSMEYGHGSYPKIVDREHVLVRQTGATITPEVVVLEGGGRFGYRGRIDDFFAELGKSRRQVREHDLRDALDALVAGKPAPKAETQAVGCFISDL